MRRSGLLKLSWERRLRQSRPGLTATVEPSPHLGLKPLALVPGVAPGATGWIIAVGLPLVAALVASLGDHRGLFLWWVRIRCLTIVGASGGWTEIHRFLPCIPRANPRKPCIIDENLAKSEISTGVACHCNITLYVATPGQIRPTNFAFVKRGLRVQVSSMASVINPLSKRVYFVSNSQFYATTFRKLRTGWNVPPFVPRLISPIKLLNRDLHNGQSLPPDPGLCTSGNRLVG